MPRWSVYLIYNVLLPVVLLVSLPGYLLRMIRRGNYRRNFGQRFGFYRPEVADALEAAERPCWIHAVSVGEVLIALKLIREMRRQQPGLDVVLSTTFPNLCGYRRRQERARHLSMRGLTGQQESQLKAKPRTTGFRFGMDLDERSGARDVAESIIAMIFHLISHSFDCYS